MKLTVAAISALTLSLGSVLGASAQDFPNRQIRVVVPFPHGGAVDTTARIIGNRATEAAGQPIIMDNRGGAAGSIGADAVANLRLTATPSCKPSMDSPLSPSLYKKLPFDPLKDFIPVVQFTTSPLLIVASAKAPITSLKESRCPRQAKARRTQLRLDRHRHSAASDDGNAEDRRRHRYRPCAIQRRCAAASKPHRRRCSGRVRAVRDRAATHPGQARCARLL